MRRAHPHATWQRSCGGCCARLSRASVAGHGGRAGAWGGIDAGGDTTRHFTLALDTIQIAATNEPDPQLCGAARGDRHCKCPSHPAVQPADAFLFPHLGACSCLHLTQIASAYSETHKAHDSKLVPTEKRITCRASSRSFCLPGCHTFPSAFLPPVVAAFPATPGRPGPGQALLHCLWQRDYTGQLVLAPPL